MAPSRLPPSWWIVTAWVVLNIYWAGTLNYGLTVFFTPVRQSFGWDAALLALIFSLGNTLTGLLSPLTGAWFEAAHERRTERVKLLRTQLVAQVQSAPPGTVLDDALAIACGEGAVRMLQVQRSGKKPMAAAEFLRGFPLGPGARL